MRITNADERRRDTYWRNTRHDILSLTGGTLVGLGLVLGPSRDVLAWALLLVGIGVTITGMIWSGRVTLTNARPLPPTHPGNTGAVEALSEDTHNGRQ